MVQNQYSIIVTSCLISKYLIFDRSDSILGSPVHIVRICANIKWRWLGRWRKEDIILVRFCEIGLVKVTIVVLFHPFLFSLPWIRKCVNIAAISILFAYYVCTRSPNWFIASV